MFFYGFNSGFFFVLGTVCRFRFKGFVCHFRCMAHSEATDFKALNLRGESMMYSRLFRGRKNIASTMEFYQKLKF